MPTLDRASLLGIASAAGFRLPSADSPREWQHQLLSLMRGEWIAGHNEASANSIGISEAEYNSWLQVALEDLSRLDELELTNDDLASGMYKDYLPFSKTIPKSRRILLELAELQEEFLRNAPLESTLSPTLHAPFAPTPHCWRFCMDQAGTSPGRLILEWLDILPSSSYERLRSASFFYFQDLMSLTPHVGLRLLGMNDQGTIQVLMSSSPDGPLPSHEERHAIVRDG